MVTGVWVLLLDRPLTGAEAARLTAQLPTQRRERLLRMRLPEKRWEVLCAYMILRRALWEQYQWKEFPPMDYGSDQKPYFPNYPQVHFNLSHTEGAVMAALSNRPVGVDLERIRPLSPLVRQRLARDVTEETFFQTWVQREAVGKWTGAGVRPHEQTSPCSPKGCFRFLDTFPGYVAGVCTSPEAAPMEIHLERLTEIL